MHNLLETKVTCPYCGELITVLVDDSEAGDEYIEDCQVCCRPIVFAVVDDGWGGVSLSVRDENESF